MCGFATKTLSAIFCVFAITAIAEPQVQLFLPGLHHTPPVELALPAGFTVASYNRNSSPNLDDGVLWGTDEDIKSFLSQGAAARAEFTKGVIWARLSDTIMQTPQGSFSHNIASFKAMGARNIKVGYKRWANLPVMSVECDVGKVHFIQAWVGLNDEGQTLHLTYITPEKPSRATKKIWSDLMSKTMPLPIEQILGLYGYDASVGRTNYSRGRAQMTALAQWTREGKAVVLLNPSPDTKVTVFQGGLAIDKADPNFCYVELLMDIERPTHESEQIGRDVCPVLASIVDTITLTGDVLFENEHLVVLKPKEEA